ncbi:MAG: MGMT family protein [Candidatus Micrarchaeia archaeon]
MKVERRILAFLKKIPKGKVVTYKSISEKFGIHPRVVGLMMRRNPHPDKFPCFRVIKSNGELGGYSKGVKRKAQLLRKDGVKFTKRINLKKYLWS